MAELKIIKFPDPRLHKIAKPVTQFDQKLAQLVKDMKDTMYAANGVGLAATQVDIHQRVIVVDVSDTRDQFLALINPTIIGYSLDQKEWQEGCLSVPDIYETVERPESIKVKAQDITGAYFELAADELLAVCIQHEIDHLEGKVFLQHLSPLKQKRIKTKIKKQQKEQLKTDGADE